VSNASAVAEAGSVRRTRSALGELPAARLLALGGTVGLLVSFLAVLADVVGTVGDSLLLYPVVLATLVAATLLARLLRFTAALALGAVLFVAGMGWHLLTVDAEVELLVLASNNLELLTGETVLRIQQADVWALTVAPTPVFLTWFLALRRRYVSAVAAGGGMLGYLVLTGDAGTTLTLLGVTSAGVVLAFGEIETTGWSVAADRAVVVLAVMVLAPLLVTIVPGGEAAPIGFADDPIETMEENVVTSGSSLEITGEVDQSPDARFTVRSEEPRLWRTGSYDRYTGDGWVQTSEPSPLADGSFEEPPDHARNLTQEIEAASSLALFPAAWQPVDTDADGALVGPDGGIELDGSLAEGETVTVTSAVPDPSADELAQAGQEYPESVVERYTQLPEDVPDRVGERTEQITQNADNPFETVLVVEEWLETNREYSLDVDQPDGDVTDAFLFEMDAGYCTYYATAMVTMLRHEEIPARLAVGYSSGEQVGDDEWLVRGLNSHAWVEVYFPEVGWVEFDPTPSAPREQTELAALEGDGENGASDIDDAPDVEPGLEDEFDEETASDPIDESGDIEDLGETNGAIDPAIEDPQLQEEILMDEQLAPDAAVEEAAAEEDDTGLFSSEQLVVVFVALAGATALARQAGVGTSLAHRFAVRFQRRSDPASDVERAADRLLLILEQRHRERRTGETVRQYLTAIRAGEDAHRIATLRERARYGDGVTRADADEAVSLVERIRARE